MHRHVILGALFLAAAILTGSNVGARQGDKKEDKPLTRAQQAWKALTDKLEAEAEDLDSKDAVEKFRKKYIPRLVEHAKAFPGDETSCEALVMSLRMSRPKDALREDAVKMLSKDYVKGPHIKGQLGELLKNNLDYEALDIVRAVIKDNPEEKTRALACKGLLRTDAESLEMLIPRMKQDAKFRAKTEQGLTKPVVTRFLESEDRLKAERKSLEEKMLGELQGVVPFAEVGAKAPPLEAVDLDGKKVKLADLAKDKVVVVDFWATWCPPCREMIPLTRKLVNKLEGKPFAFVSVSVDDDAGTVRKFQRKEPMPWTNWWVGKPSKPIEDWDVEGYPTVFLVDHKGVIRYKQVGLDEDDKLGEEAERLVKALEAERKSK